MCVWIASESKSISSKKIEAEVVIEKYLLRFPPKYGADGVGGFRYNEKFGTNKLYVYHNHTRYYEENGLWYEITGENGSRIDEQVYEMELDRPNYIKDIMVILENISHDGNLYSIFKFECRPFGYITEKGILNYDFDVDNIEW